MNTASLLGVEEARAVLGAALRAAGQGDAQLVNWSCHPLTTRTETRVVRYDLRGADGTEVRCVGKAYEREKDVLRVMHTLRILAGGAGSEFMSPRVLAYHAPRRVLILTYESGDPLTPALAQDQDPVSSALGRALAALHAAPVAPDRVVSVAEVLWDAQSRAAELGARFPASAGALEQALRALERDIPRDPPPSFVHGDFGPANLLWNGRRVVVLDFDRCAQGDPGLDVGTLFVQLRRSALRAPGRLPRLAALRERVLDAYGRDDPDLPDRVAWYERAVLLRKIHSLALDTTRHTRPDRIRQRQAEAVRLLEEGHAP